MEAIGKCAGIYRECPYTVCKCREEESSSPAGSMVGVEFVLRQEVRTLTNRNEIKAREIASLHEQVSRLQAGLTAIKSAGSKGQAHRIAVQTLVR